VVFELPTISKAVHAGGDDYQPPCGAFWFLSVLVPEENLFG